MEACKEAYPGQKCRNGVVTMQASLGLRNDSCRRLWQVWDAAKVALEPLVEKHHMLEHRLDSLLVMHDISNDGSYLAIFDAGKLNPTRCFCLAGKAVQMQSGY